MREIVRPITAAQLLLAASCLVVVAAAPSAAQSEAPAAQSEAPAARSEALAARSEAPAMRAAVPAPGDGERLDASTPRAQESAPRLGREEEMALAEEAGPPSLAADATIYVQGEAGYEVARDGSNGASCLVSRDRSDTLEPLCFDAEGTRVILPVYLERARLRAGGMDEEDVEAQIQGRFDDGTYVPPAKGGIAYMLSTRNKVFNGSEVISYPPHIMVYAPYATNAEIGAEMSDPYMPWVLEEGSPHAYIIVVVGGR